MKKMLVIFVSYFSLYSQAQCIGTATVDGKVGAIKKSRTQCRVFLTAESHLTLNSSCPMDLQKLNSEGIEVGLLSGHDCAMELDESIQGTLIDNGFQITLSNEFFF